MKMEKYESVIVDTDNILALDESNFDANSMKGKCSFKLMQFMDATHYFNEALKKNPDHLSTYYHRGVARASFGDQYGALKDLNFFINEKKDFAHAYYNRGVILEQIGNFPLAVSDYSKAIGLNLKNWEIYYKRGVCNFQSKNKKAACQDFKNLAKYDKKLSADALKEYCL
tara:strand:- start:590 stop:1099 length:510 start_codon:yes stop_codon:yes gene_type:complete